MRSPYRVPAAWTSFVEPSTSAKRKVTVPVGSVLTFPSLRAPYVRVV
jgi:hypothetical protein